MRLDMRSLLLLLACFLSTCQAKPLSVPSGGPTVSDLAEFDTLYPNSKITNKLCQFEPKGKANVCAVHQHHVVTKVPDHNVFIELATGRNPLNRDGSSGTIVNVNNPTDFVSMETSESTFCGATTQTYDGKMIQVGGHAARNISITKTTRKIYTDGLDGIRILDARKDGNLKRVATLSDPRWYPSVHLLADANVIISGGTYKAGNQYDGVLTAEVFNPRTPTTPPRVLDLPKPYLESFENKPWYPFIWQMPTGHVFMFADSNSCILNHHTGKCVTNSNGNLVTPAPRPGGVATTYPFTGSAVIAKLVPNADNTISSMDIIVFGGAKRSDHPAHLDKDFRASGYVPTARASRQSHRLTISWTRTDASSPWQFKFSDWVTEDMGYPRVMPDATLLPNGDVVILNGCQAGVAGYADEKVSIAQYPAFWASLYQPDRPANKRYTLLCGTQQPRGYHGTASLTSEGKIVVAGHDRPRYYYPMPNVPWFKNGTQGDVGPAYNVEIFHPPYVYDKANKPEITSVNGKTGTPVTLKYNSRFTVMFANATGASNVTVTSVTMVAPSSVTHSNNMNQRVISLNFRIVSPGKIHAYTPFHPYYAVPQYYMLFINNVKTYSNGVWVRLVDSTLLGQQAPNP